MSLLTRLATCVVQFFLFAFLFAKYWSALIHSMRVASSTSPHDAAGVSSWRDDRVGGSGDHLHLLQRQKDRQHVLSKTLLRCSKLRRRLMQGKELTTRTTTTTIFFDKDRDKEGKLNPFENVAPTETSLLLLNSGNSSTSSSTLLFRNRLQRVTKNEYGNNLMLVAAVQKRHQCIQAIRQRQNDVLTPFLRYVDTNSTVSAAADRSAHQRPHVLLVGKCQFLSIARNVLVFPTRGCYILFVFLAIKG